MDNLSSDPYDFTGISFEKFKIIAASCGIKEATKPLTLEDILKGQEQEAVDASNLLIEMLTKEISVVH